MVKKRRSASAALCACVVRVFLSIGENGSTFNFSFNGKIVGRAFGRGEYTGDEYLAERIFRGRWMETTLARVEALSSCRDALSGALLRLLERLGSESLFASRLFSRPSYRASASR